MITGKIPTEIGKLQQLAVLYLYDNQMSASILSELTNCTSLSEIDLSVNQPLGFIPPVLAAVKWVLDVGIRNRGLSRARIFRSVSPR
ncbi:hypothetical protein OROGR_004503 [Orobanche gracilis]